ncbi:PE domain-containing protein [Actinophytocola sediminis]
MDGYTFSSGAFHEVRQTWEDLRAGLEQDRTEAEKLVGVQAPGHEPASGFVAKDQNDSGQALLTSITQMQAFVDSYLAGLNESEKEYLAQEDTGSRTFESGRH